MSTNNQQPSQESIRQIRHTGFVDAIGHLPAEQKKRYETSYAKQDARRERNVVGFYQRVLGGA